MALQQADLHRLVLLRAAHAGLSHSTSVGQTGAHAAADVVFQDGARGALRRLPVRDAGDEAGMSMPVGQAMVQGASKQ